MAEFWRSKGPAAGAVADEEFDRLLKAGRSSMKRHYATAEEEAAARAQAKQPPKP